MGPELKTGIWDVNPKAVETQELYGYISMATREWKDGLLSTVMRNIGAIPDELPKWIMLDGDLDANWIESMNSVMDDNRMLTCELSVLYLRSLGVCGALTPSTRLVSVREGAGRSLVRF